MKLSRLFGILSLVFWLIAILTVVLPIISATRISITPTQASSSASASGGISTSYELSNHGFMAVNGIYLNVKAFTPNGTQLYSVTGGPVDVPPGATVSLNITGPSVSAFSSSNAAMFLNVTHILLQATASANLGGLLPISASANFTIKVQNNSSQVP